MALQAKAGFTRDPSHMISWGSRCKQNGDYSKVQKLAVVILSFKKQKRQRQNQQRTERNVRSEASGNSGMLANVSLQG